MPRSDDRPAPPHLIDWRGWIAVAWAAWFGILYAAMVLRERAPGTWDAARSFLRVD